MQLYRVLNKGSVEEYDYLDEVELSTEEVNYLLSVGAKLENITPSPALQDRDIDTYNLIPNKEELYEIAYKVSTEYVSNNWSVLLETNSLDNLRKRSFWLELAEVYASSLYEENSHDYLDAREGWLFGATDYSKTHE